jgi:hypothetical protein
MEAACRIKIDEQAVNELWSLDFKKQFEELLNDPVEGPKRWATDGALLRDNSRFIGAFAEFFANRQQKDSVGLPELLIATTIVSRTCGAVVPNVRPLKYCENLRRDHLFQVEEFLERVSPLRRPRP